MEKTTQNAWVLDRLQNGDMLSSKDAVIDYGIQDLPKRISELRKLGYAIQSQRVEGLNRYGFRTHWHLYWIGA